LVVGVVMVTADNRFIAWTGADEKSVHSTAEEAVAAVRAGDLKRKNSRLASEAALSTPPRTPGPGGSRN